MLSTRVFRPVLAAVLVAALGALAAPAAGQEGQKPTGEQAGKVPSGEIPKPLVIPDGEKARQNPVPNVPEAVEAGKILYNSQCAMCHGIKGDGMGDLATSLKMQVPNLATPAAQARRTDGELFYVMSKGHGDMPGEKRLADQNKWEIIRYMRTLAPGAPPVPPKK